MTIQGLALPVDIAWARAHALVFSPQIAQRLAELHLQYGSANCVPIPAALTDGRFVVCADLLTEVDEGGLLHAMWAAADKAILLPSVEVIPWSDAVALLPPDPPIG